MNLEHADMDYGFNRTFMELKFRLTVLLLQLVVGFNRTFMELKFMFNKI